MKKIATAVAGSLMILALSGCGGGGEESASTTAAPTASTPIEVLQTDTSAAQKQYEEIVALIGAKAKKTGKGPAAASWQKIQAAFKGEEVIGALTSAKISKTGAVSIVSGEVQCSGITVLKNGKTKGAASCEAAPKAEASSEGSSPEASSEASSSGSSPEASSG